MAERIPVSAAPSPGGPPEGPPPAPPSAHEWFSFDDPDEDRTWVFDVTFLASPWTCIFGAGCLGVLTGPAPEMVQGCCSYGAHFTDEEDAERIRKIAATMTAEDWQFKAKGRTGVTKVDKDGDTVTRMVDGACIFLNRVGFPAGPGCSLHQVAVKRGERPLDLKPNVCWQLPLRREDEVAEGGHVTSTLCQWDRRHWGDGGFEFHWWCTESPEAFVSAVPVYRHMRNELVELVGDGPYAVVAAYLDARASGPNVPLPHPAVRIRA
ncbi:MAG: hypothetical protein QOG64_414 [Acidimicrobiaceae bacterium]|jgi:hypothetical protein|nr:hypothetical protein [Acidimicrobiaceae bacterium]